MPMSPEVKVMLNEFSKSQPALNDKVSAYPASALPLGDVLDNLTSAVVVKGVYDFAVAGGAVGTKKLGVTVPAGAIITRLWTDAATTMTSAGAAEVAIEAGATVLKAATVYSDASYVGVDAQTVTPVKVAVASDLELVITVAALTAGKVNVFVEYLK